MAHVADARIVSFVVTAGDRSADELSGRIAVEPDEKGTHEKTGAYWKVQEAGGPDTDLDSLIAGVVRRVLPATADVQALVQDGAACLLRVVAYLSPDDPVGGGFVVEPATLRFLAAVGGCVDADLYALPARRA